MRAVGAGQSRFAFVLRGAYPPVVPNAPVALLLLAASVFATIPSAAGGREEAWERICPLLLLLCDGHLCFHGANL
jgi:hypothetical protein